MPTGTSGEVSNLLSNANSTLSLPGAHLTTPDHGTASLLNGGRFDVETRFFVVPDAVTERTVVQQRLAPPPRPPRHSRVAILFLRTHPLVVRAAASLHLTLPVACLLMASVKRRAGPRARRSAATRRPFSADCAACTTSMAQSVVEMLLLFTLQSRKEDGASRFAISCPMCSLIPI